MKKSAHYYDISTMARTQAASIQNYEKATIHQSQSNNSISAIRRDYAQHPVTGRGFKHEQNLEGFTRWYKGRLHSIHPIGPETLDKIAEQNFN